jgi:hypothetical protein
MAPRSIFNDVKVAAENMSKRLDRLAIEGAMQTRK